MDVFQLRDRIISDYSTYIQSFIKVADDRIYREVEAELEGGALWPEPLIQLNPFFEPGGSIDDLVAEGLLQPECSRIFRIGKGEAQESGRPIRLYKHQSESIRIARKGDHYILTTGTGSGKSLSYIVPIVDFVLRNGSGKGIQAIIVYPMNALANSQVEELSKFLCRGYPEGAPPVTFARYTGEETEDRREEIIGKPPDILLTNYMMLEYILTRPRERRTLVPAARGLKFLVFDELHTYRGRQGADVAMLIRRVRDAVQSPQVQCIGTSATIAGVGSFDEQRRQVADVASALFGVSVKPDHVVGETLRRATRAVTYEDADFIESLRNSIQNPPDAHPTTYHELVEDSLSIWIENTFGLETEEKSGRLVRATPKTISGPEGAAKSLAELTGVSEEGAATSIRRRLLAATESEPDPETQQQPFAFRLHQFISRGDTAYASLEGEDSRYITLSGQVFVPGDRTKILFPVVFCRECGQEYYTVWSEENPSTGETFFSPRNPNDMKDEGDREAWLLHLNTKDPWPEDPFDSLNRLPDDWVEDTPSGKRLRSGRREWQPKDVWLAPNGRPASDGLRLQAVKAPFRFCLSCGISYAGRQVTDFAKLSTLSSEGRSTATTILSLSAINGLKETDLPAESQKLLSFMDNRQDASLQAGHLNDFVETTILRAGLHQSVRNAGSEGIYHQDLTQRVFESLNLPIEDFARDPGVQFHAKKETERALREVLGYRIYLDLRRGWRVTSPNLEQCGLLKIDYISLDEVCSADELWNEAHPALVQASPKTREHIARTLLDYMRRELAIRVDYLDSEKQERIRQLSSQYLREPWGIDEDENMIRSTIVFPRGRRKDDYRGNLFLSSRGGFGQFLRRDSTFPDYS